MEELRKKLKCFISYNDGIKIRKQIRDLAITNYQQKYTDSEHIGFLKRHTISTTVNHPQSLNNPYYYGMFSVCTQHIMADTIEQLLDKAIDIEKKENTINKMEDLEILLLTVSAIFIVIIGGLIYIYEQKLKAETKFDEFMFMNDMYNEQLEKIRSLRKDHLEAMKNNDSVSMRLIAIEIDKADYTLALLSSKM